MQRKYTDHAEAVTVAKEALWLAWEAAGGPAGMGWLKNNPGADKEAVWKNASTMGDYFPEGKKDAIKEGRVNADYVFGRMLKLRFGINGNSLDVPDYEPRYDYQAWCGKYPTYAALFDAAELEALKKQAA